MHTICKLFSYLILTLIFGSNLKAQESPTESGFVMTDDHIKLYTKKSGNGPLAIFIHGGPGAWSESFEALGGNNLESHLTMIYMDQRGCGRSESSTNQDYSMQRMLKDIDLVRQKYGAEKVYLIAHSFGGILAVNYAQQYPAHVKGLILANSTLNLLYSIQNQMEYMNTFLDTEYKVADASQIIPTFKKAQSEFIKEGLIYKLLSDNKSNIQLLDSIDSQNPSQFDFAKNALQIQEYLKDYTTITHQIKAPVLVITGKKDHAIGEAHFKSFQFPEETIKQINGGHLLYYENNKEFTKTIVQFVKANEK